VAALAAFPDHQNVNLSGTAIGDDALRYLKDSKSLEGLILSGTNLTIDLTAVLIRMAHGLRSGRLGRDLRFYHKFSDQICRKVGWSR
jgi:hypothetical protein